MVIRRVVPGVRASGLRSLSSALGAAVPLAAFAVGLAVGGGALSAQEGAQNPAPSGTPAPAAPAPGATAPAADPQSPAAVNYARVVADKIQLRCWPGAVAMPPVFEDVLVKDQVVAVGRSENGFRAVVVPLGPIGYVSSKFTVTKDDGRVFTKGAKVSFRYRPRSAGEPPVTQLADGTELFVIGEQDEWFKVRAAGVEAWVAEAEVQLADPADPALAKGYETWRQQQQAEVQVRLDQIAAQQARAKQDVVDLAEVQVAQDAFQAELGKPAGSQQLAAIETSLDQLAAKFAPESAGRPAVEALKRRVAQQRWVAEASAVLVDKPPRPDEKPMPPSDRLERFQSIGWLRYESRLAGPGVYFLEKGGQRQYLLSCTGGRYDLALFVGREVGVIGPRRRPSQDSLAVLDVERIEVLGTTAR